MAQNPTLLSQIDTPVAGANGGFILSPPGASGNIGQPGNETLTGDAFPDPAGFSLFPTANGGSGGGGVAGSDGGGSSGSSSTAGGVTTLAFANGTNGQPGGNGGRGGAGNLAIDGFTIGSVATPNTEFGITATASGGTPAIGAFGGGGGDGGYDSETGTPVTGVTVGATGGDGADGGAGGSGGAASSSIDSLTDNSVQGAFISIVATGTAGAHGGTSGNGGRGGFPSDGGAGGGGGDGGAALATLTNSALTDNSETNVSLRAISGGGGNGGQAGRAGFGLNLGINGNASTTSYAANPTGGTGGNAGQAQAVMSGNTLTGPIIDITLTAISSAPGAGGPGTTEAAENTTGPGGEQILVFPGTPGATGAAGTAASQTISMTNNVVTLGTVNAGFGIGDANSVQLGLMIGALDASSPSAVALNGAAGGNLVFSGNSFTGTGHSEFNVSFMGGGVTFDTAQDMLTIAGSPGNPMTGFTTFRLGDNDTVVVGAGGPYTIIPATDPDTVVLTPGHGNVTIDSATTADLVIEFQGYGGSLDLAAIIGDTAQAGGNTTITIPGDGSVTLPQSSWSASAQDTALACFAAGTRIATPAGETAVENLRAGDLVMTASGEARPVRWIGHRHVNCRRHARPETVWPLRIAANAFAPGQPARDLFVSPDHAVCIDTDDGSKRLVPAKYLANGASIAPVPVEQVTYYHVELPTHDVLLAEGLACESYLDTGNRAAFENGGTAVHAHPDFALKIWHAAACEPLLLSGPPLHAARRRLLTRLPALGHDVTADPNLTLLADGATLDPQRDGAWICVAIPDGATQLRLHSRHAAPIELDAASDDTRRLGVAISDVSFDGTRVALDDGRLATGWHDTEETLRWTDGDACVDVASISVVDLRLAPSVLRYHARAEAKRAA